MNEELDKKLVKDFPELYKGRYKDMTETAMCWGFSCGGGWYNIIYSLSESITNYCKNNNKDIPEVLQVKEKFGTLRFYTTYTDDYVEGMINIAEHLSNKICETCGKPGKLITEGWYYTACEDHIK